MVAKLSNTVSSEALHDWFGPDPATTTGLTFGYKAGFVLKAGVLTAITAGTIALTANASNMVYIDKSGTPVVAVALTTALPAQVNAIFLCVVDTDGSSVISATELRGWHSGSAT